MIFYWLQYMKSSSFSGFFGRIVGSMNVAMPGPGYLPLVVLPSRRSKNVGPKSCSMKHVVP